MNPSWFIPIVGNILVPIAGVPLGYTDISWFFFSIGIVFWPVLLTIIFYRIIFHPALPGKLIPTFFILIAPPAVGFLSYMKLTGEMDNFARILYFSGLFFTLLVFAAWTSAISLIEPAVAWLVENRGMKRGPSAVIVVGLFFSTGSNEYCNYGYVSAYSECSIFHYCNGIAGSSDFIYQYVDY